MDEDVDVVAPPPVDAEDDDMALAAAVAAAAHAADGMAVVVDQAVSWFLHWILAPRALTDSFHRFGFFSW